MRIALTYGVFENWSFIVHTTTTGSRLIEKSDCTSVGSNYYATATEHDISNGPYVTPNSPMSAICDFSVASGDKVIIVANAWASNFPRWAAERGITQATITIN